MNDEHDSVPQRLKDMISSDTCGRRITIERKPSLLGWHSARVTIAGPELPAPVTFTVHWREPSTCYVGLRKFFRSDGK